MDPNNNGRNRGHAMDPNSYYYNRNQQRPIMPPSGRAAAVQKLQRKMETIPGGREVFEMMVYDWINNIDEGDLSEERNNRGTVVRRAFSYEDIRELVEGFYEENGENAPPPFTNDDYKKMYNYFSKFVREWYRAERPMIQGGKRGRRGNRKHRQTKKKTRRSHKKTRKHK